MQKKLTITIDEKVYDSLHRVIAPRKISRFIDDLVRPHVLGQELESAYAEMSRDEQREKESLEWAEATLLRTYPCRHVHRHKLIEIHFRFVLYAVIIFPGN